MDSLKKIFTFLRHSLFLVAPGGITALGLFLFASGRFNPLLHEDQAFFLILMQLQALGITIAKFGLDQVIFSRLGINEYVALSAFFKKRVIPLVIIYSLLLAIFYTSWNVSLLFSITLPLEVYGIILITEHNINRRFNRSFVLMLTGYPLVFTCLAAAWFLGIIIHRNSLLFIFLASALIKSVLATYFRVKQTRRDEADYSLQIPVQQVTNIWMFRSDQLLIATHLYSAGMGNVLSLTSYLFLAKLPEISGAFLAYLSPILYKRFENNIVYFSLRRILEDWFFWLINAGIILAFLVVYLFFDTNQAEDRWIFYLPFLFHCLLVLPANMTTYMRFKSVSLGQNNFQSMLAIVAGVLVVIIAIRMESPFLFALSMPVQLLMFIALYQISIIKKARLTLPG